ncbi:acetyl-CoA synthetase-like protein [Dichomitus squalens]|nr:acetyl-CoA synthetase-like protein [Dichomitus squalens]
MPFPPDSYVSPKSFIESGKATIPELYEWNARENPSYHIFRLDSGQGIEGISYAEMNKGILRAARLVSSLVGPNASPGHHVVAIVASADTITYATVILGILRAGHVAFPISPRNSAAAVADLLSKTKCTQLLASRDPHMSDLVKDALAGLGGVKQHAMPQYEDLFPSGVAESDDDARDFLVMPKYDLDSPAMILHSSGSTSHPKPITWSHRGLICWGMSTWKGTMDSTCAIVSAHGVPMYHAMGSVIIFMAATCGWVFCVFPPASPPTVPNSDNVFEGAVSCGAELMYTVPAFLEQWAREPDKVLAMKQMRGLLFGGAPLNKSVGDSLASQGVALLTGYGSTETGSISAGISVNPRMDWEYFGFNYLVDTVMRPAGDGTYELVILATSKCPPRVFNDRINGIDAYATSDLLEPHSTKPGLWKIYGRVDDQIILSNGEKTNPLPLEHIIRDDPHVRGCLIFGRGRLQNGVLIEPMPDYLLDPQDEQKLADFRNKIWPTIERANAIAPQHSRVFKEMIMVTLPSKPFTYNAKGFPRRVPVLQDYENEIEALYATVEQSSQGDVPAPSSWNSHGVKTFVHTVVQHVLGQPLAEDADLFRNGCDSLQATYIRNIALRALREHSPAAAKRLPMNVMFQAPTIVALTDALLRTLSDSPEAGSMASTPEDLIRRAERYGADLPARPSGLRPRASTKDVVLVTGTTGGFGCDILEHLLRDSEIGTVYAFNRKATNALERQRERFLQRGHDVTLLESPKFRMVEADLQLADFGVEPGLLGEIRASVTHIMHNAWQVNFNLKVTSFEGDLQGLRNLLGNALSSPYTVPPKFIFVSSIGVLANYQVQPPESVPEERVEPSSAIGSGYTESKWVAEETLHKLAHHVGIPTTTVRLGQVCGDKLGHWNEKEWFPALVKSSLFTRCLPGNMNEIAFILSHPAARAFVEMRKSSSAILHLVHPRPIEWKAIVIPMAKELGVPLVPYSEWLSELEKGAGEGSANEVDAMRTNPALRLLDFFRAQRDSNRSDTRLSTAKAELASEELAHMCQLGSEDAMRWITAWRASGFLPAAA